MEQGYTPVELTEYQCHKKVHATPMNLGDYNTYRGWKIPDNENPSSKGYLVVYNKDTDRHYESWSPEDIFNDGYTKLV